MSNLQQDYESLSEEISIGASADGELKITEFFRNYAELAAENGDCPDLDYAPILSAAGSGHRIDGFAFDLPDESEGRAGDLHLAICAFFQEATIPTLNAIDIDRLTASAERFLKFAFTQRAMDELEEASPAYRLMLLLRNHFERVARVRIHIFTNGHLKTKKKVFVPRVFGEIALHTNVFDLERYSRIASHGVDPVEVDFVEDFSGPIHCLLASAGDGAHRSYLFAIHGPILAEVFARFGNRLLEQNVRTYLQAKTNVNKGILKTITTEPTMFFAYNNGLTATASAVRTIMLENGTVGIAGISDFQIVNGGQTTASLLYARDGMRCDLDKVFVQCKLSVVDGPRLEDVVPRISACANTQNKVSLADFAANSPAQTKIERLSKEVSTPQRSGAIHVTRWFYERSRGQYKNLFSYKTAAEKRRLELEFPKTQLIEKTDLAKSELSFAGRPHHVSEGAQKCFARFVNTVLLQMNVADLNEKWFRDAVAKGIIFREIDKRIAQTQWYREAKGLKAQTVAYTVAACAHAFRMSGREIDLDRIWREQTVPTALSDWMLMQARSIHQILTNPPGQVKDAGEFCKKEFCWEMFVRDKIPQPDVQTVEFGVSHEDVLAMKSQGRRDERMSSELDFEIELARLLPRAAEIRQLAENKKLVSELNSRAMQKLVSGRLNFNKGEKNALKNLLERLGILA
ncbi:MAG: AIPR family protein [Pseudomonadota bacterium]